MDTNPNATSGTELSEGMTVKHKIGGPIMFLTRLVTEPDEITNVPVQKAVCRWWDEEAGTFKNDGFYASELYPASGHKDASP